jgi:hypothetical protein
MRDRRPRVPEPGGAQIFVVAALLALAPAVLAGSGGAGPSQEAGSAALRLDSLDGLELINARADLVTYRARRALRLSPPPGREPDGGEPLAILPESDFEDGTIEAEIAGAPRPDAPADMRGFVGIVFRAQQHGARFEHFYLRPTNGRAEDQLRRNHSVQYQSVPEYPWHRLRKENPGVYESYADLQPGVWTKLKIVVSGTRARLYVNGADQPCLVVNDLKMGRVRGQIGLWAHPTTEAYFSEVKITRLR